MSATQTYVPTCLTPFRIVRCADPLRGDGYKAVWVRHNPRQVAEERDALAWRPTKAAVRASMANLFADVTEVRGAGQ